MLKPRLCLNLENAKARSGIDDVSRSRSRALRHILRLGLQRAISRRRIHWCRAPRLAGLRKLLGGCDQVREKGRIGPRQRKYARLMRRGDEWDQRGTPGRDLLEDAVFHDLFAMIEHCKPSQSGTPGPRYGLIWQSICRFRSVGFPRISNVVSAIFLLVRSDNHRTLSRNEAMLKRALLGGPNRESSGGGGTEENHSSFFCSFDTRSSRSCISLI